MKRPPILRAGSLFCLRHHAEKVFKKIFLSSFFVLMLGFLAQAQKIQVKGIVKDDKGNPAPNATITLKNTSTGVFTDAAGNFSIEVPNAKSVLQVSFAGFQTQEIAVGDKTDLNIVLVAGAGSQLNEVVVVGYGSQKKVTVTGAVAQVKGADLEKVPSLNLSNTLVGRLPGLTAVNSSGEPGYDGSAIRIRGTNSFGNTGALIVIDGIPDRAGGLDRLNPADIESVSVLKDASAAIYGSRSANGVILITTRHGKTGKPKLSYDFNQGWAQATRIPKMMDVLQYGEIRNELAAYDVPAAQWGAALSALKSTGTYVRTDNGVSVSSPVGFFPDDMKKYADGSDQWGHPDTDWFGDVLKNWSPQQRHNLQINGGSENIKYLASLGYQNQDGYYKNSATGYKQYDMRVNLDAKVNEYINVSLGLTAREEFRFFPTEGAGAIFRMLMRGKPNEPAIWPNGLPGRDIENGQNPVVITTNQTGYDKDKRDYFQTNGKVEFLIPGIKGLKITGAAAVDKYVLTGKRWATPWYLYSWDRTSFEADGKTPKLTKELRSTFTDPRLRQNSENALNINLSGLVNYDRTFGKHAVNILAGIQKETINNEYFNSYRRYFISTAVDQLFAGGDDEKNNGGGAYNRARLSYFGRVGYNYQEKYIAEFLWRYDGSYNFPKAKRFGFFPGVMAGWRISEENFFKENVQFINNLKVRASWGQMGAEPYLNGTLAEYFFLSTYNFTTYVTGNGIERGLNETRLPNLNFTWEVQNSTNFGIEATALNNRVNFEFDYFINKRNQVLLGKVGAIPQSAGISSILPPENYGKLSNRGWEMKLGYNGRSRDFSYSVSVNGGYAKNKVILWTEAPGVPAWQTATGHSFGSSGPNFLAYQYDGVFATQKDIDANTIDYSDVGGASLRPGDMKFKDINGDKRISDEDKVRLDKNRDPWFTGGMNITMQYKNFDCSILFQGATGGLLFIGTESGDIGNYLEYDYNHRWTVDNPSSVYPRIASRDNTYYTGGAAGFNDYRLKSSNYLRLKNFELGYAIPTSVMKKAGISNFRVYANGINLITWDKMKIYDPETVSGNGQYYPQARVINVGARITF